MLGRGGTTYVAEGGAKKGKKKYYITTDKVRGGEDFNCILGEAKTTKEGRKERKWGGTTGGKRLMCLSCVEAWRRVVNRRRKIDGHHPRRKQKNACVFYIRRGGKKKNASTHRGRKKEGDGSDRLCMKGPLQAARE